MTQYEAQPQVGLNIQDFDTAIGIFDALVERGACRGEEIAAVGNVRTKFVAFRDLLKNMTQQTDTNDDEQTVSDDTEEQE